jgi:hypothetical protein
MKYRKLRIAWSVGCSVLCLMLTVLWMRGFWVYEGIVHGSKRPSESIRLIFASDYGTLCFARLKIPANDPQASSVVGWDYQNWGSAEKPIRRFLWGKNHEGFVVRFPTWLPVPFLALVAGVPWVGFSWRFNLRVLLIVVAVISVFLGMAVWVLN